MEPFLTRVYTPLQVGDVLRSCSDSAKLVQVMAIHNQSVDLVSAGYARYGAHIPPRRKRITPGIILGHGMVWTGKPTEIPRVQASSRITRLYAKVRPRGQLSGLYVTPS